MAETIPSPAAIQENRRKIDQWIVETPVWHLRSDSLQKAVGANTEVFYKLELLQHTGSFKARGAVTSVMNLNKEALQRGVVAASAGNHAIAVSYAAKIFGTTAKVIMPKFASPIRIEKCKNFGAEVILMDTFADALKSAEIIAESEGRTKIHPFEGPLIVLGTGTLGLEMLQQIKDLDAVVIPGGGGGLIGGIAAYIKQTTPKCEVFGVEPRGADALYRSLRAGKAVTIEKLNTIAESLATPCTMPYSFSVCQKFVDDVVLIDDADMVEAMKFLLYEMKLAAEPAAAASTAALFGPLKERLKGKRVGLLLSGSNIDVDRYCNILHPSKS